MDVIKELIEEHEDILEIITYLESIKNREKNIDFNYLINLTKEFHKIWNEHEKREETFFKKQKNSLSSIGGLFLEHKELKGYWEVLKGAIKSREKERLINCIDNDGKLFFEKIKKHMNTEEGLFEIFKIKAK